MIERIIKEVINNYIQENLLNESRGVSANQYSSTIHSIVKLIEKTIYEIINSGKYYNVPKYNFTINNDTPENKQLYRENENNLFLDLSEINFIDNLTIKVKAIQKLDDDEYDNNLRNDGGIDCNEELYDDEDIDLNSKPFNAILYLKVIYNTLGEINTSQLSIIIAHELHHAYQFYKSKSKNKTYDGYQKQFYYNGLESKNKNTLIVRKWLHFISPGEINAMVNEAYQELEIINNLANYPNLNLTPKKLITLCTPYKTANEAKELCKLILNFTDNEIIKLGNYLSMEGLNNGDRFNSPIQVRNFIKQKTKATYQQLMKRLIKVAQLRIQEYEEYNNQNNINQNYKPIR